MKKIILLAAFAAISISAIAVPARPFWRTVSQPDGSTVEVRVVGDEFGHVYVDRSGNALQRSSDGYLRPVNSTVVEGSRRAAFARRKNVNARRMRQAVNRSARVSGTPHIPVVLVEFKDRKFKDGSILTKIYPDTPEEAFNKLLNTPGYSYNGAQGSVNDFYVDNSNGVYSPVFDILGKVTLDNDMATYGGNDETTKQDQAPELALYEAVKSLNSTVDFSRYDLDSDGEIDMMLMYYAGDNEAEAGSDDTIWPHQWSVQNSILRDGNAYIADVEFDGKKLGNYFCTSEASLTNIQYDWTGNITYDLTLCGIGTTCHEFAHSLGLPDFYDTDYEDNYICGGTYAYDTMCEGSYNNDGNTPPYFGAEELIMLGWIESLADLPFSGNVTIPALSRSGKVAYKGASGTDGEYFVFECRSGEGWDKYIPDAGLIVYHVDKSKGKTLYTYKDDSGRTFSCNAYTLWNEWEQTNAINCVGTHPCYYIIPAACQNYEYDHTQNSYYGQGNPTETTGLNYSGSSFAFGSGKYQSYTPVDWKGATMDYTLKNISFSNGSVSFKVGVDLCYITPAESYAAGGQFPLSLTGAPSGATVVWYYDDVPVSGSSVTLTAGEHLVEARITTGKTSSRRIELKINVK